ncbi:MAG: hypothetical protein C0472_09020 [Erythrobacter sp.]|nr:hypothetical protein [Erythrobacter sp.]
MGAYPNRSNRNDGDRLSLGADARSNTASQAGIQAGAGASSQSAHAIEPITMRVPDACRYIGISRSTLYVLIAEGEIEIIKLGCSTLVLTESLNALIAKRRRDSDYPSPQVGS